MSALQNAPRMTPFLWFDSDAEEAVDFYLCAFNGGPIFRFTEAVSLVVRCDSQAEVDEYWPQLFSAGRHRDSVRPAQGQIRPFRQVVPARSNAPSNPRAFVYSVYCLKIRQPLVPPKPNEFDSAYSILIGRALFGT